MVLSINQPAYLPWLGYFHRIYCSDLFVFLDNVQFEKNSFTNRNKIKTAQGSQWLTVPVRLKEHFEKAINEIEIDNSQSWQENHLKAIYLNYKKAPFFEEYFPAIERFYKREWRMISDLNYEMMNFFLEKLGIGTKVTKSSELGVKEKKDKLVLEISKSMKAKVYLSGILGKDYLKAKDFSQEGINLEFQNYNPPKYNQRYQEFLPNLGIIDLLFNEGPESLKIIMSGNITKEEIEKKYGL